MKYALFILLVVQPALADEVTDQVRCAEIGFSRSLETRQIDEFAEHVDPDARFVSGKVNRGRAAVVEAWSRYFTDDGPQIVWRPAVTEVMPSGDLALSRGPYRYRSVDENGQPDEVWGHFISTWRRSDDGRWRVIFDTGGDSGMTPSDEEKALLEAPLDCEGSS